MNGERSKTLLLNRKVAQPRHRPILPPPHQRSIAGRRPFAAGILELDPRFMLATFAVVSLLLNNFGPLISKQLDRGSPSDFWGCFLFGLKTSEWFLVAFAFVFGAGPWLREHSRPSAIPLRLPGSDLGFEVFPGMPRGLAWILLIGGLVCIGCIAIALKIQARVFGWEFIRMKRIDKIPAQHSAEVSSIGEEKSSAQIQIELRWFFSADADRGDRHPVPSMGAR